MKPLFAFMKKEFTAHLRSGKIFILGGVFLLLGFLSPATAKITPWLLEMMSESMAESGMNITITTTTALDSWLQFYKNLPIGIIVFLILEGGIFTKEYRSGTLVLTLTKGLERYKVVIAKSVMLTVIWSIGYWMCFGITYGLTEYLWDNSIASHVGFSAFCTWLFGFFLIALIVFFSTIAKSGAIVLVGCGGVVIVSYLISIIPKVSKYLPILLSDCTQLIYGLGEIEDYVSALIVTVVISILCFAISIPIFNKKEL